MNNPAVKQKTSPFRERYAVTLKGFKKVPGTFHRDNPSYLLVDLLWLFLTFLASLVAAADQLITRRRTLGFAIQGDDNTKDFANVSPDAVVKFLSENVQQIQDGLKHGNRIHFLAAFIDPLPKLISQPPQLVRSLAGIVILYYMYRFWLLHRNWRYNTTILLWTYLTIIPINMFSKADLLFLTFIVMNCLMPVASLCSVFLHKMLTVNAWKPLMVVLELEPKQGETRNENSTDEATHGLLKGNEDNEKEDV